MKYITIPGDVLMTALDGEPLMELGPDKKRRQVCATFRNFLIGRLGDPRFGKAVKSLFQAIKMRELVLQSEDVIALEDADHKALLDVIENPSEPYNMQVAHNIGGFLLAVVDAPDKPLETAETDESAALAPSN